jgi:hypothetical protein
MLGVGATLYADLDQLLAWWAVARPGGMAVRWASGAVLDDLHPAAAQVNEWRSAGMAEVWSQDSASGRVWLVRKAGEPSAAEIRDVTGAGRLLAFLRGAADGGRCPSYGEMAEALQLRNRQAARHLFNQLVRKGAVRVSGEAAERRIEIMAGVAPAHRQPQVADTG